jgi:hypothetical protein
MIVFVEESAESIVSVDMQTREGRGIRDRLGQQAQWSGVGDAAMRAVLIVVVFVLAEGVEQGWGRERRACWWAIRSRCQRSTVSGRTVSRRWFSTPRGSGVQEGCQPGPVGGGEPCWSRRGTPIGTAHLIVAQCPTQTTTAIQPRGSASVIKMAVARMDEVFGTYKPDWTVKIRTKLSYCA